MICIATWDEKRMGEVLSGNLHYVGSRDYLYKAPQELQQPFVIMKPATRQDFVDYWSSNEHMENHSPVAAETVEACIQYHELKYFYWAHTD